MWLTAVTTRSFRFNFSDGHEQQTHKVSAKLFAAQEPDRCFIFSHLINNSEMHSSSIYDRGFSDISACWITWRLCCFQLHISQRTDAELSAVTADKQSDMLQMQLVTKSVKIMLDCNMLLIVFMNQTIQTILSRLFPHSSLFWIILLIRSWPHWPTVRYPRRLLQLFLILITKLWHVFLSLSCAMHMKVFPCTILSGKTHHLAIPQGNCFAEVFPSSSFIRIWFSCPAAGRGAVRVSNCQQYQG